MSKRYTHRIETRTEYEYSIYRDGILAETSSPFFTEAMAAQCAAERCAELESFGSASRVPMPKDLMDAIDLTIASGHGITSAVYKEWRSAVKMASSGHEENDE